MEEAYWLLTSLALKRHMFFLLSALARTSHMALNYLQGRMGNAKAMESLVSTVFPTSPCFVRISWDNVCKGFTIVPEEAGQTTQADSDLKLGLNEEWVEIIFIFTCNQQRSRKKDTLEIDQEYRGAYWTATASTCFVPYGNKSHIHVRLHAHVSAARVGEEFARSEEPRTEVCYLSTPLGWVGLWWCEECWEKLTSKGPLS